MALNDTEHLVVADRSSIGTARTAARRAAGRAGLDATRTSEATIVASELATNLVRHAGRGTFVARAAPECLTLVTWDAGPGIPDIAQAFGDGFSTGGTQGTGLGAVRRLSDAVDVRSARGEGTIVVARLGTQARAAGSYLVDGLTLPLGGAGPCGDAFGAYAEGGVTTVMLADGLGHGPEAADAAERAVACLATDGHRAPAELLTLVHGRLRATRGAAVAVARLDPAAGRLCFASVGNVEAAVASADGRRGLLTHNGIVGREMRRAREVEYALGPDETVVLHTDGVRGGWSPAQHPGVLREDPLVIAAALINGHERGRDDVGAVAVRPADLAS